MTNFIRLPRRISKGQTRMQITNIALSTLAVLSMLAVPLASKTTADDATSRLTDPGPQIELLSTSVAAQVDRSISEESAGIAWLVADDYTFLRRVYLDVVGLPATPAEITRFGLDPALDKRQQVVEELLQSDEYAVNWTRYWRDAIFTRATNVRSGLVRAPFTAWMTDKLDRGAGWDEIVTELLTASGPVNDNGATALIFAHEGVPEEIAAEASRLFTGIQIQCANCHDHPWDRWKREQFHELVAFFPRVSVRRERGSSNMFDYEIAAVDVDRRSSSGISRFFLTRLDRDKDGAISEGEAGNSPLSGLLERNKDIIDKNGDGKVTIEELLTAQPPAARPGQGATEHFMPDLSDPGSQGRRVDPKFFVTEQKIRPNMADQQRRSAAANMITSPDNPWFARAIVNRLWYEMTGTAFYTPIDDIGPDREARHEAALQILCSNFIANDYDLKWLIRTIAATQVYQRAPDTQGEGFARCEPVRLRSDQLYSALCQSLNVTSLPLRSSGTFRGPYQNRRGDMGREEFARVFGFDPSVLREDLTGSIPEALFLMNSGELQQLIGNSAQSSEVSRLLRQFQSNEDLVAELYLACLGREPTQAESRLTSDYLQTSESRREGVEDLMWALVNSPEFMSKR